MRHRRPKYFEPQSDFAGREQRGCEHPGCVAAGEFRAPRSRSTLNDYFWFCLDHVRAYNATWDYYRGMTPAEIERSRRDDVVGGRPSWKLGERGPMFRFRPTDLEAALDRLFGDHPASRFAKFRHPPRARTPQEKALTVLELPSGATPAEVKARYKQLVKRHHPDANGGDKNAEERLKLINQAYTFLKGHSVKLAAGG